MFEELIKKGKESRDAGLVRETDNIRPTLKDFMKEQINVLSELGKEIVLSMTMESLRGSWSDSEERLAIIFYLCDTIKDLPKDFLDAVRHNAFMFDAEYIDGRVFRDGDRTSGLSGNLSYDITGDDRLLNNGFHGTYGELQTILGNGIKTREERRSALTIIQQTSDCSFEEE